MSSKRQWSAGALLVMLAFSLTYCAPSEESVEWGGSVTDSAGVSIVSNPEAGLWTSTNAWRIEPLMTVGSAEGDPDYEFGQIAGIAVTSDGRIFVFDQQAQHLKVFSADGVYETTIGRAGGGPGEIGAGAGPVLLGAGDTLYIPDIGNRRVDRFTSDGEDAGSYVLDIVDGIPLRWEATSAGRIVSHMRPLPSQEMDPGDTLDVVVLRDSEGQTVDTLLKVPSGRTFTQNNGLPEFNFFSPEPAWALGDGLSRYFGVNNDYRIGYYDADGDLARVIIKAFVPQPVTDRDQEIFTGFLERAWQDAGVPEQALSVLRNGVNFNDTYPAYLQFLGGPEGTLWVQHVQALSDLTDEEAETFNPLLSLGGDDWDVFDSQGRFLGLVQMPARFQPIRFVGTDIYGIWQDEFDVQYLQKVAVVGVTGGDV